MTRLEVAPVLVDHSQEPDVEGDEDDEHDAYDERRYGRLCRSRLEVEVEARGRGGWRRHSTH